MDDPLPLDLIFNILLRLPVKSLCRFRCVSSVWRSIISDPQFVSAHFARSSAHPKLFISVDDERGERKLLFSTEYPREWGQRQQSQTAAFHDLISSRAPGVSQSLGGMICIATDGAVLVCNPSTGERVSIATPWIDRPKSYFTSAWFGFDPVENKYKILHWSKSRGDLYRVDAHVLTLGENRWRKLTTISAFMTSHCVFCVDGVIYSIALDLTDERHEDSLLAFDVRMESIRMIPLPIDCRAGNCSLTEFQGRLALIHPGVVVFEYGSEIMAWTLEGSYNSVWSRKQLEVSQGLAEAFSNPKLLSHGITHAGEVLFCPHLNPIGITRDANVCMWSLPADPVHLYFYHLKDASMRTVEVYGLRQQIEAQTSENQLHVRVIDHVEGLQSLSEFHVA